MGAIMGIKTSKIWAIDKAQLQNLMDCASTYKEILTNIGMSNTAGCYTTLKEKIKFDNIDASTFLQNKKLFNQKNKNLTKQKYSDADAFTINPNISRHNIKSRIIKNNIFKYECKICKQGDVWQNKKIVLVLDHINGINNDHRLENLRFLCPNCNSQTETFTGKNTKRQRLKSTQCPSCKKPFSGRGATCLLCANFKLRKVTRPSPEKLTELVSKISISSIGKLYGVTGNTIRKWCKFYNILYK